MSTGTQDMSSWQRLWSICAGATSVLVVTSVNQFPSLRDYEVTLLGWFFNPVYSGWIWSLLALESTCIGSGIILLTQPRWREIPARSRINWAFAFFALAWVAAVAFIVRLHGETPMLLLWIAAISVVILGAGYWFWRRRIEMQEEMFP